MTIDEQILVIQNCKLVAARHKEPNYRHGLFMSVDEFDQLILWLEKLKEYDNNFNIENIETKLYVDGFNDGYNVAINEIKEKVIHRTYNSWSDDYLLEIWESDLHGENNYQL